MRVHARLQAGRYPNCRKLADELEVSSKTVQRDLDFMRDRLGLPIQYDQLHFGFFYSEPVTSFPNIEISEGELVALYIGQKALAQYKGTSFETPLSNAFRKITDGLRNNISFSWSELEAAVSFRSAGRTVSDLHAFEQLSHAVFKQLEARFEYKKPGAKSYEERSVQPYHLGCVEFGICSLSTSREDSCAHLPYLGSEMSGSARPGSGARSTFQSANISSKVSASTPSRVRPSTRSE